MNREYYNGVTAETYGLAEVHNSLLRTLDVLDKICRENDIYYSIHAGTLLGAVRNHKIIPWDDDMDITMTRENYIKLKKACDNLRGRYYLNTIDTWVPRFVEKNKNGLTFIDIFIWDYITGNKVGQKFKYLLLRTIQGMLKRNISYKDYGYLSRIFLLVTNILGKPIRRSKKIYFYNYVSQNFFIGKKQYIHRSNDRFHDMTLISEKKDMESYMDIELEGHTYMVNRKWEEILIQSYGKDYLTPPPPREWKVMHEKQRENFLDE